ncbi:MAG: hypothetical protein A3F74_14470 [Betaproteobacteria bacterium RIFCSPLOWO2_12_FULL_62_58]|nr:MAG: hypothetical protein A3F74_14470 [Betaproteobacteria bacterium RIFCSPLOWO2_12_FULL_62_58]
MTARNELHFLTLAEASALIAARKLSPLEYTQALLARVEALEPQIHAFITKTADLALDQARTAEKEITQGRYRGPLHGIPFGAKDIYETAGILTSGGSKVCIDNMPRENSTAVQRLLDSGAVLLGKLNTHEFASGGPSLDLPWPPARNPWNTAHYTGGSSSGSGAAVAAGFLPAALGTDTGGSIRIPAAMCGVAGIKPTFGRVSRRGVIPNSFSFDHTGPLAWTVEDCAIILQAIAGHDPLDPASANQPVPDYRKALNGDIRGLRVGVIRHFWEEEGQTDPELAAAMNAAIEVLKKLGARLQDVRLRKREAYHNVKMIVGKIEIAAIHEKELRERPGDFGADFLGSNLPGFLLSGIDYVHAQRERRSLVEEMDAVYEKFDVLLTASSAPAPRLDNLVGSGFSKKWENPNIYVPFNVTGSPALIVCNGYTKSGLPLAMQIAGRPFDELSVFRVGHAYEQATQWRARRPSLEPGNAAPALAEPTPETITLADLDPDMRNIIESGIARAGLKLTETQRRLLYRIAPTVIAAANRIRNDRPRGDDLASTFSCPDTKQKR